MWKIVTWKFARQINRSGPGNLQVESTALDLETWT